MKRVVIGCVVAGLTGVAALAGDWPRWRGPNGDSMSPEKGFNPAALAGQPKILWSAQVGNGYSALTVAGGRAFTLGNRGDQDTIFCFDAATGQERWKHSYPSKPGSYAGPRASPWVDGDLVYTMGYWGDVCCLEAASGKVVWQKNVAQEVKAAIPQWGLASSTYIHGNLLLLNLGAHGCALDKKTGRVLWSSKGDAAGYATPVVFSFRAKDHMAVFGAKGLSVVDLATGKPVLEHPWETKYDVNAADPVFADGRVFISSGYGKGCALLDLRGPQPKEVWRNEKIRNHFSTTLLLDGRLYGCDGSPGGGDLVCLDWTSGSEAWRMKTGFGSLMAVDGHFVFLNEKGELIVVKIDPKAGQEVARGKVIEGGKSWTAPTYANGRLYCRNDQGQVVCVAAGK